jgi:endonuclease/exonuclease/phosphatase family metal-dependent hydrolase
VTTLRILTYNVRSLRDDRAAVSRTILAAAPDVVAVQEAPRFLRWRARGAELARHSGLVVLSGGHGAAGNLLLCQLGVEVEHSAVLGLSHRAGATRRGAAVAVCSLAGRRFAFVGTHLDLRPADRMSHVCELYARLADAGIDPAVPLIVAGDINETPGEPAWEVLARRLADGPAAVGADEPTFPAQEPRRRIDGVFVDRRLRVTEARVLGGSDVLAGSDHRPVLTEVELDQPDGCPGVPTG